MHYIILTYGLVALLALFVSCTHETNKEEKAIIDTYLSTKLNKNLKWEYKQLNISEAYKNPFRDTLSFNKAIKIQARKKVLENYYAFLKENDIDEKNPSFPLLSAQQYKEIENLSIENGFIPNRLKELYAEINEFYEDIRLYNENLQPSTEGWDVDCVLNLKDKAGKTQNVHFVFLLNPEKTKVIIFEDKNDQAMIEIHQVIKDAISENY